MRRSRTVQAATRGLITAGAALGVIWGALALYFSGPGPTAARMTVALVFAEAMGGLVIWMPPRRLGWPLAGALFAAVLVWWLLIPPRNDRDWQPDLAALAWADVHD